MPKEKKDLFRKDHQVKGNMTYEGKSSEGYIYTHISSYRVIKSLKKSKLALSWTMAILL